MKKTLKNIRNVVLLAVAIFISTTLISCGKNSILLKNSNAKSSVSLIELYQKNLEFPTDPLNHISIANYYLELNLIDLAEEEIRTAISLSSLNPDANYLLAKILFSRQKFDDTLAVPEISELISAIESALSQNPVNQRYLQLSAEIYLKNSMLKKADEVLRSLLKLYPKNDTTWFLFGELSLYQHHIEETISVFSDLLKKQKNKDFGIIIARAYFIKGDEEKSLSIYSEVQDQNLQYVDRLILASLALRRSAINEAEAHIRALATQRVPWLQLSQDINAIQMVRNVHLKTNALADFLEARVALHYQDFDKAEIASRRAISVDRRIPQAAELLSEMLLVHRKDARQAFKVLNDAPEENTSYKRYFLLVQSAKELGDASVVQDVLREFLEYVVANIQSGQRVEARLALESMMQILPYQALWQFVVDLAIEEDDAEGLLKAWENIQSSLNDKEISLKKTAFIAITGSGLIEIGKFRQAEEILRQGLSADTTNVQILVKLAKLFELEGDFDSAEDIYRRVTIIQPNESRSWVAIGYYYLQQGNFKKAKDSFEESILRDEQDSNGIIGLARAYEALGQIENAYNISKKLVENLPDEPKHIIKLASLAGKLGRYNEQEHYLLKALKSDSSLVLYLNAIAKFYISVPDEKYKNIEAGVRYAKKSVELTDYKDSVSLSILAESYFASGKQQEALSYIDKAIVLRPELESLYQIKRRIRTGVDSLKTLN